MEKINPCKNHRFGSKNAFWTACVVILLYRFLIIVIYASRFVDDDQAIMWCGTAAFGHFEFYEPMFWGQKYGSMIESLLAVPLYWLRVPLNWALPVTTALLGFAPFFYLAWQLHKRHDTGAALLLLLCYVGWGWRWDVLTTVPRSLFSGFPFALIGIVLINESINRFYTFMGAFLAIAGFTMTTNSIAILGIGLIFYGLYFSRIKRHILAFLLGSVCGVIFYVLSNHFYVINPDYNLHIQWPLSISLENFLNNLQNILTICKEYMIAKWFFFPMLPAFFALVFWVGKRKHYVTLVAIFFALFGTLAMFSTNKLQDFVPGSLLFGQMRMLLFVPYITALILYLDRFYNSSQPPVQSALIQSKSSISILYIILLVLVWIKFCAFSVEALNKESALYCGDEINLRTVESLKEPMEELIETAEEENVDVIISVYDRGFGYALSAMNYGDYIFYNGEYDRRTWVYHQLKETAAYRCLFTDWVNSERIVLEITDTSIVDYLAREYDLYRNPNERPVE